MKKQSYLSKSRYLLLFLFALIVGSGSAWADAYTTGFESTDGWATISEMGGKDFKWSSQGYYVSDYELSTTYKYQGSKGLYNGQANNGSYFITPKLAAGTISFWAAGKKETGGANNYVNVYKCTDNGDGTFTIDTSTNLSTHSNYNYSGSDYLRCNKNSLTYTQYSFELDKDSHLAFYLSKAGIDNFSASNGLASTTPAPVLTVYSDEGATKSVANESSCTFGPQTTALSITYYLKNTGTANMTNVKVAHTGNAVLSTTDGNENLLTNTGITIASGAKVPVTVTMASTGNTADAITVTADNDISFALNDIYGTIKDNDKVISDFTGDWPDDWSHGSYWYKGSGYIYSTYSSSSNYFQSPEVVCADGDRLYFKLKKYSTSTSSLTIYTSSKSDYSADLETHVLTSKVPVSNSDDYVWVSIPLSATVKYIAFMGANIQITELYGCSAPAAPKLSITQSDINLGLITEDTKTSAITITNSGKAPLTGLTIGLTGSDAAKFSIVDKSTDATTLAANASMTFKVQMSAATAGAYSATVTIGADAPIGANAASFKVSGAKVKAGTETIAFNSTNITANNWVNTGMTINADNIYNGGSADSKYITSPKLQAFTEGDFLVAKVKNYNTTWTDDYVQIEGSNDNGLTWTKYSKKILSTDFTNGNNFYYVIFDGSDLVGVNKIRIHCYYAYVYELSGFNYAPVLSVTTGDPASAVSTPANYDFGECAANATVTYNFANAGAGTINITNVAITGDGAAAYSTNWTESVAAPFDLVITRGYDANRTEAQAAVVTVTTSEGAFVINVTGTDQAANAPEFAVLIGEAEQTTGANLGFGTITANTVKTFKIQNAGTGALNITAVTLPDADYTTDLESAPSQEIPLVIAAGTTKTINVTLAASAKAIKSDKNIVISAEGFEDFTFVADAIVMPGATIVDFNNNALPDGWTNNASNKWSFADGKAYCTAQSTSPAELVTKKLQFVADDFITISASSYDNYDNNFLEILGSTDNGDTWTAFDAKKYISKSQIPYGSYATITVTGIPNTVNKLKFRGYYVYIDEIAGLVYDDNDPAIAVFSDSEATQTVTSGTTKDFGWAQSAQNATYYIKNGGTGTLTISDIDVPAGFTAATAGDVMTVAAGADPLALTVTMTAGEIGEKSGTITLTTDGGNFTIPVKGFIYGSKNLVDFTNSSQYTGWTGVNVTDGVAALSSTAIQTTKFAADAVEKLYVEIKGSSSYGSKSFSYSYSRDNGANWSAATALVESTYSNVADQVFTISDIANPDNESTVLIRFTGSNLGINRIYGFTPVATPVMALDKTDDYNFGMQTAAAEYVITVTNNGTGDLEHLEATLTTGTDYTVSVAATTVAPGENTTITITQKASTAYASHSDVLTISADDVNNVVINLSGKTRDAAKYFADFEAAGMPVGWTATGWSRTGNASNYYAQAGYSGTNTLQTPALTIAAGEEIKYDAWVGYAGGTFKVRYTTNGGISWTEADVEATTTQTTKTLLLGNETAVTAYIQFVGDYYARIDNFYGGTAADNAPLIQVTKSAVAVENGATEAFGDILAQATAEYTIKNIGNGSLTFTSVSATGVATADVNDEWKTAGLANGESATLTITMPVAAPYGEKSGAVTVKTSLGDFVINYTATTKNPNTLNVDFSSHTIPSGWYMESGWSYQYTDYLYKNYIGNTADFITQKLDVAGTDDVLKFQADMYSTSSYYTSSTVLKVSYSTDRVNWTEYQDFTSELTGSMKDFEVKGLAAGQYYLKFTGRNAEIDNIIGWTKVTGIEHDLYVTASTFPATTDKGDDATITATVTSLRAAETGVYAKLFIDGVQEGDDAAAQDIALNGTKTFSFTYAIPENKTAQIKVYYSDDTEAFATAVNNMKVNYTFDEEVDPSTITAGTFDVTLNRSFVAGWNTICLPFAVTDIEGVFGDGVKIYGFDSKNGDNLRFTSVDETVAGTPYLIKMPAAKSDAIVMNNVSVSDAAAGTVEQSSIILHGSYAPMAAGTLTGCYGVNSKNQIAPADGETTMKGFRAYFSGSVAGARISVFDETTGITTVYGADKVFDNDNRVYNLKGQHVENAKKGIYIVNGKKVVIK